jgi:hypothetical protein
MILIDEYSESFNREDLQKSNGQKHLKYRFNINDWQCICHRSLAHSSECDCWSWWIVSVNYGHLPFHGDWGPDTCLAGWWHHHGRFWGSSMWVCGWLGISHTKIAWLGVSHLFSTKEKECWTSCSNMPVIDCLIWTKLEICWHILVKLSSIKLN